MYILAFDLFGKDDNYCFRLETRVVWGKFLVF